MHVKAGMRAQAAVDFMVSYGIALIIIVIAVAVMYNIAMTSPVLATQSCTASPGFACSSFAIDTNGLLTISLSQATGGEIVVHGISCSSQQNTTGNKPAYGNIYVTAASQYYFSGNSPGSGVSIYSDSNSTLFPYCYSSGGAAAGSLGSGFIGFVWLNYTVPGYGNVIQQVASLDLKYT